MSSSSIALSQKVIHSVAMLPTYCGSLEKIVMSVKTAKLRTMTVAVRLHLRISLDLRQTYELEERAQLNAVETPRAFQKIDRYIELRSTQPD